MLHSTGLPDANGDGLMVQQIHADGCSIGVTEGGSGRPLLLVMGLGGNMKMWHPLMRELHPLGIRTISYDCPGMGQSPPYRRPRRLGGMARTAVAILDELGYDEVDVLGVSFGGGIAQELAHRAPDRVRRLVLCATSAGMVSLPGNPSVLSALATPRRYWDPDYYQRIAPRVFGGRARNPGNEELAADRFAHPPSAIGYGHQLFAGAGWTSFHWLGALGQPTLVMAGDDDPIVPLANARLLDWRIPDSRLAVVRGGGHLFVGEEASSVASVVADFLLADTPGADDLEIQSESIEAGPAGS